MMNCWRTFRRVLLAGLLALETSCAGPPPALPVAVQSPPPPPAALSPEVIAAENAYAACLARAARYADDGTSPAPVLSMVIAPMCYPQFEGMESTIARGFDSRDRRAFERTLDQRQMDAARDAIERERRSASLSDSR